MNKKRILLDGSMPSYETLYRKLSYQKVSKPIIQVTTIHHKKTQQTSTEAKELDRSLRSILDSIWCINRPGNTKTEMYLEGRKLKHDIESDAVFETRRFYVMMTEMSEKYKIRFLDQLNDQNLTLYDKQTLLDQHCKDVAPHVIRALSDVKMPSLIWERPHDDTWQITLGILQGTLTKKADDTYVLYITSIDRRILLTKTIDIQDEGPLENVQNRCMNIMNHLLESYRLPITLTKDAVAYQQHHEIQNDPPGTIYVDNERTNELAILRHKLATMFQPIERTDSDHYNWLVTSKTDTRTKLRERLRSSETFNMLVIGSYIDRPHHNTIYEPIVKIIPNATLADIIPQDTGADEWFVTQENGNIYVETKHLHGSSEYECRKLRPDVSLNDVRLEQLEASLQPKSNCTEAAITYMIQQLSEPLGNMYRELEK